MSKKRARENFELPEGQEWCCISHSFQRVALKNPNKIAVIQASPTAQLHNQSLASSHIPPPYHGDRSFTFSHLSDAIDSLSFRLRSILAGAQDPFLINPTGNYLCRNRLEHAPFSMSSTSSKPSAEQSEEIKNKEIPKILGIYMVPSVEYIIAVLSVLRCGEAFMPLDPSWPKERILSIVSSSNVDLIIGCRSSFDTSGHFKLDKSHWLVDCNSCPVLSMSMEDKLQNRSDLSELVWPCEKEELRLFCYLMYTSGSTGKPKGICGTEKGLLNRFLWMQEFYPLLGEEILLFKTSISFVDHLQEFLGAILSACTLVIPPFNELKQNPFHVIDYLKAYSVTRMTAVPSLMRVIIPALQSEENMQVQNSLKFLVLSGEVLPLSLWNTLSSLLPQTSILNLYGSTEVSGDCTYFDCRRLPRILESDSLSSVPIGIPISNCNVMLVGESDTSNEGEICVNGLCVNIGYFPDPNVMPLDYSNLSHGSLCNCSINDNESQLYFRTGDFARRLQSGDLVFLGRKDRTVKINGQRIALEEIENALRGHPDVVDAAVIFRKGQGELELLEAFIILKRTNESDEVLRSCIRRWMVEKLPLVMVPNNFFFTKSFPMSATGKVDYASLAGSISMAHIQDEIGGIKSNDLLEVIKKG